LLHVAIDLGPVPRDPSRYGQSPTRSRSLVSRSMTLTMSAHTVTPVDGASCAAAAAALGAAHATTQTRHDTSPRDAPPAIATLALMLTALGRPAPLAPPSASHRAASEPASSGTARSARQSSTNERYRQHLASVNFEWSHSSTVAGALALYRSIIEQRHPRAEHRGRHQPAPHNATSRSTQTCLSSVQLPGLARAEAACA
jgi:hypothetical protein